MTFNCMTNSVDPVQPAVCQVRAIPEKKHLGEEDSTFVFTKPPMEFNFLGHQPPV